MAFINPTSIVDKFGLFPGMKVADFGSGSGHFSIEMAKRVGNEGTIFAFDVQKQTLSSLKSISSLEGLLNIETNLVNLETEKSTNLADDIIDLVLISNMFFQLENKEMATREAFRILKQGGKAILIESKPSAFLGAPKELRVDKMEAEKIFNGAGFSLDSEFEAGESHYGMVFIKP